jgi:Chaperone of endosialidase
MKPSTRREQGSTLRKQLDLSFSQLLLAGAVLLVVAFGTVSLQAQAPLFIDKQGQVGIGTNQPKAQLDVNGNAIFRAKTTITPDSSGTAALAMGNPDGDRLQVQYKVEDKNYRIGFGDGAGNWKLWNDFKTGNVYIVGKLGVGTDPSAGLDVKGDANVSGNESVTGNVGIGGVTPGFPLSFPNTLGDKISLWGQSGDNFGFGIQNGLLQIHSNGSGSDIVFGYGASSSLTERMRIKGNGRVGIGTSSPDDLLDVNGTVRVRKSLYVYDGLYYYWPHSSDKGWKNIQNKAGEIAGSMSASAPSDLRLKQDLQFIPSPLEKIRRLRGVTYQWNDKGLRYLTQDIETSISAGPEATAQENQKLWQEERAKRYKELGKIQVGVVAQDVEAVLPEAVTTDESGYKRVKYDDLIPLFIEALKEEDTRSREQAQTIMRQQAEIQMLSAANQSARQQLAELEEMKRKLASVEASVNHVMAAEKFGDRKDIAVAGQSLAATLVSGAR